jgi:hypothetical protein
VVNPLIFLTCLPPDLLRNKKPARLNHPIIEAAGSHFRSYLARSHDIHLSGAHQGQIQKIPARLLHVFSGTGHTQAQ